MLNLRGVHEQVVRNGRPIVIERPYIRLNSGDGPPIFVQDGECYSEAGDVVEHLPPWFDEELAKLTPEALESVNWGKSKTAAPVPAPKPRKTRVKSEPKVTIKPASGVAQNLSNTSKPLVEEEDED